MGYSVHPNSVRNYQKKLANKNQTEIGKVIKEAAEVYMPNYITYIILLKCSAVGIGFNGARNQLWNCTHFMNSTDEQLQHRYIF